jgi:curved DNA-binding protein CbpA
MAEGDVSEEDLGRVPRLAPGCDPTSLELSPAEGFLLSRIDGNTTWRMLREIGGLPAEEVDFFVEDWLSMGVINIDGRVPSVQRRKQAPEPKKKSSARLSGEIDESLLDPSLDMDVETQRKILTFEAGLDRDYFQILGVELSAEARDIKRAYFALSKEFHPDLYFRRNIGDYAPRLNAAFKGILEAYELLADPDSRAEIRRSVEDAGGGPVENGSASSSGNSAASSRPIVAKTPLERLRQRMPFKVPDNLRRERSDKGEELFEAAQVAESNGDLADAVASLRLAIAFDSGNAEFKQAFGRVQAELAMQKIDEILTCQSSVLDAGSRRELQKLIADALAHRSEDHEVKHLVARSWLALGNDDQAMEYAEKAAAELPNSVLYLTTVAEIHLSRSERGYATKRLEEALRLDPSDVNARKMYERLKKAPRGIS